MILDGDFSVLGNQGQGLGQEGTCLNIRSRDYRFCVKQKQKHWIKKCNWHGNASWISDPLCREGNLPVDSLHKGPVMQTIDVSLFLVWTNCWANSWAATNAKGGFKMISLSYDNFRPVTKIHIFKSLWHDDFDTIHLNRLLPNQHQAIGCINIG